MLVDPAQRSAPSVASPESMSSDLLPFNGTKILHTITAGGQTIHPEIHAKVNKGFRLEDDGNWTCYRRNYVSLSCSFSLPSWTGTMPLFVEFPDRATKHIISFAISISAVVNAPCGETRELIQHTTKRDKQTESKPGMVRLQPMQPTQPPSLVLNHGSSSATGHHLEFGLSSHPTGLGYSSNYASPRRPTQAPIQHTFERIQFQKATANNGKRRAQQQHYRLVVELHAELASGEWIKIARQLSNPVVVRGRSPIHYKSAGRSRRDHSTTILEPDIDGSRIPGDGGGAFPPGPASNSQTAALNFMQGYDNILYTPLS